MSPSAAPLVTARDLRVDAHGRVLCERLSLESTGSRTVLIGAGAAAIARAVTLRAQVTQGSLLVCGHDVGSRQHVGRVGIAPLDPPLPPRMKVDQLLALSFRAAGFRARQSQDLAVNALQEAGLPSLASRRTETLAPPEKRAVTIAQALLPQASCLFLESPLEGLEGPAAAFVLQVLGRVSQKRMVAATASRFEASSAQRDLLLGAHHVLISDQDRVLWSGPPEDLVSRASVVAITAAGDIPRFLDALAARGLAIQGDAPHLTITLDASATCDDLFRIAQDAATTIIEMEPLVTMAAEQGAASSVPPRSPTSPSEAPPP